MSPDFNSRVRDALAKLDGTTASAVSLLTGQSREEIAELGGVPEEFDVQIAAGPGFVSQLLNANDRGHWATKEARRRYWLDTTTYHLRAGRDLPKYLDQHVHITITIAWPDRRKRDAANYYDTGKVIVDAVVRSGFLTDDADRYVTGPDMRRAYGPHEIRLTITPTGAPA